MANFPQDATSTFNATTYYLASRKPDRGISIDSEYKTSIFISQSGHEKRQAFTRRPKRKFSLSYTNISGAYKRALENFYRDRNGEAGAFEFDLTYIGLSGSIIARFDGSLKINQIVTTLNEETDIYTVTFTLTETFS